MTPRAVVHCVRHAEGFHNLGEEFFDLPDPSLTPLGKKQCEALRQSHFGDQSKVKLVMSSPMSRALHTAFLVFQPALEDSKATQIIALPDTQEVFDYGCDTGRDVDALKGAVKENGWPVDLRLVHHGWNDKSLDGRYSPVASALQTRARAARTLLNQKIKELASNGHEDIHIALVAHGSFLHFFTNDWEDSAKLCGTGWSNCEARSYTFHPSDLHKDNCSDEAWLLETRESRMKRGLHLPAPSLEQQQELFGKAMDAWTQQGLPDLRSIATASVRA